MMFSIFSVLILRSCLKYAVSLQLLIIQLDLRTKPCACCEICAVAIFEEVGHYQFHTKPLSERQDGHHTRSVQGVRRMICIRLGRVWGCNLVYLPQTFHQMLTLRFTEIQPIHVLARLKSNMASEFDVRQSPYSQSSRVAQYCGATASFL
jgi:hypothetical protein